MTKKITKKKTTKKRATQKKATQKKATKKRAAKKKTAKKGAGKTKVSISQEIKTAVQQIIDKYNMESNGVSYVARFKGKFLYLDRDRGLT